MSSIMKKWFGGATAGHAADRAREQQLADEAKSRDMLAQIDEGYGINSYAPQLAAEQARWTAGPSQSELANLIKQKYGKLPASGEAPAAYDPRHGNSFQHRTTDAERRDATIAEENRRNAEAADSWRSTVSGSVAGFAGHQATADANAATLDGLFSGVRQAYASDQSATLHNSFADAMRRAQFKTSKQGLSGSSIDASNKVKNVAGLIQGRQRVQTGAADTELSARNAVDSQRLDLKRQVVQGLNVDLSGINNLRQQQSALNEARSNVAPVALGGLFTGAGQVYEGSQIAQGFGRQGFKLWNSPSSQTGSIT